MNLKEEARALNDQLSKIRQEIHRKPEVAYEEKETSALILKHLQAIDGYEVQDHVADSYGIIADLEGGRPGKTVALRADFDALPIQEETNCDFASENPGAMHACGHDMHTTMLLGAAKLLADHRDQLAGKVRLIFQPAEEYSPTGGSRTMIKGGALDGVDAVFGQHVWPDAPFGTVLSKPGPMMAASDHFFVDIYGKSAHAATPQLSIDAMMAQAQFVMGVQGIISRNKSPMKPAVITIGTVEGGNRYNIVADHVHLEGTVRTFNEDVRDLIEKRLDEVLQAACQMYSCKGEYDYKRGYAAVNNDPALAEYFLKTARDLFGDENVSVVKEPAMTAEDFSFYLLEKPGAYGWLGVAKEGEEMAPLHNSKFLPDSDILWRGAAFLASLAMNFS